MKLRVLGSAGAEFPHFHPPGFLLDETLLLDAGTIGAVLAEDEQWAIRHILITHAHLDHIRGIPVLADNILIKNLAHQVKIAGPREVLAALKTHLLNNIIWPDFARLPSPDAPVISYLELEPGQTADINGYAVTACRVNHSVPAVGYIVRRQNKGILYTGDTGPTETIWQQAAGLSALIVEASFPNAMEERALLTGHLTPQLLGKELWKVAQLPPRILVTHPKPQYYDTIRAELEALRIPRLELLRDGNVYEF
jgi:ribonuclease BN (tRNA processing enzyme)